MAGVEEFTGVGISDDLMNDFQKEKYRKRKETNANSHTPKTRTRSTREGCSARCGG